jgi:hypothetical protein
MSDQTSPDAGAVDGEVSNPEAEQDKAAVNPDQDTQAENGDEEAGEAKTFTQAELNDIVKKEKARAEAKAERRVLKSLERLAPQQSQAQQQNEQRQDARPSRREGEADDEYLDRLTDWKLDQRDRVSNQQRAQEQNQKLTAKTEKLYSDAEKIEGFDRDEFNEVLTGSGLAADFVKALVDSDHAPKLMAYIAANPEDAERIGKLSSARQAAELGKLETRLGSTTTPTKRASAPITPIGSRGGATPTLENASLDDYIALRKKQGAGWARR